MNRRLVEDLKQIRCFTLVRPANDNPFMIEIHLLDANRQKVVKYESAHNLPEYLENFILTYPRNVKYCLRDDSTSTPKTFKMSRTEFLSAANMVSYNKTPDIPLPERIADFNERYNKR